MNQRFGLTDLEIGKIRKTIFSLNSVEKIILYGSRAIGNYHPGSDVDLTLIAPTMTLSQLLTLENELDDLMLPQKIDLSLFHQIDNSDLIEHIQRVGKEFV